MHRYIYAHLHDTHARYTQIPNYAHTQQVYIHMHFLLKIPEIIHAYRKYMNSIIHSIQITYVTVIHTSLVYTSISGGTILCVSLCTYRYQYVTYMHTWTCNHRGISKKLYNIQTYHTYIKISQMTHIHTSLAPTGKS
jgi:hypothetical protein